MSNEVCSIPAREKKGWRSFILKWEINEKLPWKLLLDVVVVIMQLRQDVHVTLKLVFFVAKIDKLSWSILLPLKIARLTEQENLLVREKLLSVSRDSRFVSVPTCLSLYLPLFENLAQDQVKFLLRTIKQIASASCVTFYRVRCKIADVQLLKSHKWTTQQKKSISASWIQSIDKCSTKSNLLCFMSHKTVQIAAAKKISKFKLTTWND